MAEKNTRFHAVLANAKWSDKNLYLHSKYLNERFKVKKTQPFFDVYEKSLHSKDIELECKEAVDSARNKIQQSYINMLKACNNGKHSIYLIGKDE